MNLADLNFAAITDRVTIEDRRRYNTARGKSSTWILAAPISAGIGAFILLLIPFVWATTGDSGAAFFTAVAGFSVLMVTALLAGEWFAAMEPIRLHKFAEANRLSFQSNLLGSPHAGAIFEEGYGHRINQVITLPGGIEIANYQYETGSGKSHRYHPWVYVRIALPRHLPHMILDANSNNFFGKFTNLPVGLSGSEVLSLEGDFDRYFKLYAPEQYRTDALYIFTPDVMSAMIDRAKNFDVEIIDNSLLLYSGGSSQKMKLTGPGQLQGLIEVVTALKAQVDKQAIRYADQRIDNRAVDRVAEPGRRLKGGLKLTTILTALILAYYLFTIIYDFIKTMQGT